MLLTQSSQKSPHLGWCCAFQWGGRCIIQSSICSTACQTHIKAVKVAPGWQAAHSSGLPTSRNFNFVSLHKIEPGIATVKVDHMYDAKAVQLCAPSITTLQTKQPYFVILCNVQMWLFSLLDTPILLHTSTLLDNTDTQPVYRKKSTLLHVTPTLLHTLTRAILLQWQLYYITRPLY